MAGKYLGKKVVLSVNEDDDSDHDSVSCGSDGNDCDNEDTGSHCGLSLQKLNLGPRKKLLVFSLNGCLIHRVYGHDKANIPSDRSPDGTYGKHLVFKRPFAEEFMQFCLERFEIGIWSSAQEKHVDGILESVMGRIRNRLSFVWDQAECTDTGFKSVENTRKPLFVKDLKGLWKYLDRKYSESDTLLIDDKPYKALLNPPHTGIFLDSYTADNVDDNALDPKGKLGKFLDGLAVAKDVQLYVKDNPFDQPAISQDHPEWKFYSSVLQKLGKRQKP
ncbi:PREDICTED: probable C-terminal domain small phosphatase [Fragaria vesca subsp. vesca]|uniref:probable C-terminal domain small phosphatase n=1 Tax=Fragaria vesca subsp. vesca TaxID=101020 RepID=UPI0002C36186|nr:PREDICTED: probable C-terminal domain small phosphatase [Fragaria vesca subsp. vesca]